MINVKYHTDMIAEHYRRYLNGDKDYLSLCMYHILDLEKFIFKKLKKLEKEDEN